MIFSDNTSIFDTILYHFRSKGNFEVFPYDFTLRVHKETKEVIRASNPLVRELEGKSIKEVFNKIEKDYEFTGTI